MLEIQSSLTRGSLVWFRSGRPPMVLSTDSRAVPYKSDVDTSYFIKTTMQVLAETIDDALRRLASLKTEENRRMGMPRAVKEAHYVLSSPWIASQARSLSLSFHKDTAITGDKVAGILDAERAALAPEGSAILEAIEEKIFDVRLNGYSVSAWRGKQARELGISYAVSVCGADTTRRLRRACERAVKPADVHFHSSLLLQYVGLCKAMPARDSYILIHVHGELTDAVVVKDGSCVFFGSYPMGTNTVVRKIAKAAKTDVEIADSLLTLYLSDKFDREHGKQAEKIMEEMSAGWSGEFKKLFKDSPLAESMPTEAIMAARAHEDFFLRSFSAAYPGIRLQTLSIEDISPLIEFDAPAELKRVVGLYALAINSLKKD